MEPSSKASRRPGAKCFDDDEYASESLDKWVAALEVLDRISRHQVTPGVLNHNAAISACVLSEKWAHALELLKTMQVRRVKPNSESYSGGLSACAQGNQWKVALELLRGMHKDRCDPDKESYNSVICACGSGQQWDRSLALLRRMLAHQLKPDAASYGPIIGSCQTFATAALKHPSTASTGKAAWKLVVGLLEEMVGIRLQPDIIDYNSAIQLCDAARNHTLALVYQRELTAQQMSALLVTCERGGRWEKALSILETVCEQRLGQDAGMYAAAIGACGRRSCWKEALALLGGMLDRGPCPDAAAYGAAADACSGAGRWEEAMELFAAMQDQRVSPTEATHAAVARGLCHCPLPYGRAVGVGAGVTAVSLGHEVACFLERRPSPEPGQEEPDAPDFEQGTLQAQAQAQMRRELRESGMQVADFMRKFDDDGNGSLSRKEFRKWLRLMKMNMEDQEADALFKSFDRDHSGSIDSKELAMVLKLGRSSSKVPGGSPPRQGDAYSAGTTRKLRRSFSKRMPLFMDLFQKLDEGDTGLVSIDDFKVALGVLGSNVEAEDVELLCKSSMDASGMVQYRELYTALKQCEVEEEPTPRPASTSGSLSVRQKIMRSKTLQRRSGF